MIWAQDLAGTGITVNTLLPGGATATGMIPAGVSDGARATLLDPDVIVQSDGIPFTRERSQVQSLQRPP